MQDNPTAVIQFVQTVEKYNVLYDYTNENYCNRLVQEKTWNNVGKELNETGLACKEKWKNIRSAYTRYLRQTLPSGSAATAKKKYYLAEYLQFLIPFTKSRHQTSNTPSPNNLNDETDIPTEETLQIHPSESAKVFTEDEISFKETSTPVVRNKKRKEMDPLETCALNYLKKKSQFQEPDDPDLLFLRSLLPDLHRMNNSQKYEFKCKTMQTIGDILYKSPTNNATVQPHSHYTPTSALSSSTPSPYSSVTSIDSPSNDYDFLKL